MKKVKIGIFGCGPRGKSFIPSLMFLDCEIVALCENREKHLKEAAQKVGGNVATFTDFDEFIKTDMDAVILTNYFHEHTPYAIKCFERGIHVLSECISNSTMAEGVRLVRAFEKSKSIYMLAENYPQMKFNREMQRVAEGGTLGKILYAEGEYNHPVSAVDAEFYKTYTYMPNHWRNYLPGTYYITHSLGPIMRATGATPKKVSAFPVYAPAEADRPSAKYVGDRAAVMTTLNDDGSVFKFVGCGGFGAHGNSYRLCGENGQIENVRGMGEKVMLRYNSWNIPEGMKEINLYDPEWNDKDEKLIVTSGHGGADFVTLRMFVECVKNGTQPRHPFDIYSAVAMSSTAILAHRAIINGGGTYEIPDFKTEEARKAYENDEDTPFYGPNGEKPTIPCCSNPDYAPTEKQVSDYFEMIKED